ncbi:Os08g0205125 [Oryza sativa Japonica Group]|uniref:Os08g0205125 protein n=1 Tax=Oryza sativa subsp. japonica TaxID=39947 RepID=A0A0P0XD40_ORYSJ|nr:hypothetical protein EE612_042710 [Oryza sativa]BAT04291.1 Os08g0205125 [Oryza sativa Japonica Group]
MDLIVVVPVLPGYEHILFTAVRNTDKIILLAPAKDQIKHHIMHPATHHHSIIILLWLNQTPIDKLIEIALANILQILPGRAPNEAFGYPLSNHIIPVDTGVLWVFGEIQEACSKMKRKILVAQV